LQARRPNDCVYIFTSHTNPEHWRRLLHVIGHEDLIEDPRFATREARNLHEAEIDRLIADWTLRRDKNEAMRLIGAAGVPAGAVLDTGDLLGEHTAEVFREWLGMSPADVEGLRSVGIV
jgi:crotonobetainyl-CoA:carnitine CoA-transferase CaiB-like acyl-CoA transferase